MNLSKKEVIFDSDKIESSYIKACMLDIECIKPGNVNLVSGHDDTNAKDFISSYKATSKIITLPDISLGERIESCIVETKKITTKNTNLGIILLCSLFSQSLLLKSKKLDESIHDTIMSSTNDDVTRLCKAITLANPGGLGSHDEYDVNSNPKVTLYDLMKASAEYDQISNQYYLKFKDIFSFIIPTLHSSIVRINNTKLALSYTFLKILEKYPDSHLRRKYGNKIAKKTSNEASDLIKILDGDTRYESWGKNLISLDKHFKMARVNPGTTADLLVVSMMIYDYFIGIEASSEVSVY